MTEISQTMTKEELHELAHGIAYDACCAAIESNCLLSEGVSIAEGMWWDVREDKVDPTALDHVKESLIYLEARGLIVRHAYNANWIQLQNESEATA